MAADRGQTGRRRRFGRVIRELGILALLLGGILSVRSSLADHYVVPSGSMQHTLQPGDRVVVDKRAYGLRLPFTKVQLAEVNAVARGDVVIFDSPADGTRLIKRIVAVGGDHVRLRDGHLTVNGRPLSEPGQSGAEAFGTRLVLPRLDNGGGPDFVTTVPEGMLLALGDHRGNSRDSRYFGAVPEREIYGRAIAVYYRRDEGLVWRDL